MDIAKLGFTIDAEGARHEITLTNEQLRVLANGGRLAAAEMKALNSSMGGGGGGGGGPVPPDVPPKIDRLTESIKRMKAAASQRIDAGFQDQIAELDPFQSKLEEIQARGDQVRVSLEKMRAAGREKLDMGLSSQIEQLDPFQKGLAGVEVRSGHAGIGIGRLANQVTDLGARLSGVHPIFGKIVEVIGQLALGHAVTLGVIAGITAIAFAWDKLTESTRKATEEQNKLASAARDAAMVKALGPGGAQRDQATAVAGRISDLQEEIKQRSSFLEALKAGSAQEFNLNPADRAQQIAKLKQELAGYGVVLKGLLDQIETAKVQQFVSQITAPFDYAVQRGNDVLGFYNDALAAQRQLNEQAKSGTVDVKNAALQGLAQVQAILDKIRLQRMGLAEAPGQVQGISTATYGSAISQTVQNLGAQIDSSLKHGGDLVDFGNRITSLYGQLRGIQEEASHAPESFRRGVQDAIDQVRLLIDALDLAKAQRIGGGAMEDVAASIRTGAITPQEANQVAIQQNAQAQHDYGVQLAIREAAVKLPSVFDVVREASLRLAEGLKSAKQSLRLGIENWKPGNIVGGIKQGATQAGADFLQQFSPANITAGLVTSGLNFATSAVMDFVGGLFDSGEAARKAAAEMRKMKLDYENAIASFRHDDLASSLASNAATAEQLRQQAEAIWGSMDKVLKILGVPNTQYADALREVNRQEELNAESIRRRAAEDERYAQQDLQTRMLKAQGRTQEADDLAFRNQQEREYQAALDKAMQDGVISTSEAAYLASLLQVQAAEKIAHAMGILNDAVRNAPTGFDPAVYGLGQNYYGPQQGGGAPIGGPGGTDGGGYGSPPPGRAPAGVPAGAPSSGAGGRPPTPTTVVFQVSIPEGGIVISGQETPQTIARKTLQGISEYAATSVGGGVPLSTVMEIMRTAPIFPS